MESLSNTSSYDGNTETLYYPCLMSPSFRYVQSITSVILFVTAIFGNCLILTSLFKYSQQFKGSLFIFIGNLAFADLILGVTTSLFILEEIIPEVMDYWQFCYTKTITFLIPFCASVFFMTSVSIDRYMAVLHPFKHHVRSVRKRFFFIWCSLTWILVIATGLCFPLIAWNESRGDRNQCRIGLIIPESYSFFASCWLIVMFMINAALYVCNILLQYSDIIGQDIICVREYTATVGRMYSCLNWIVFGLDNKKFRTVFKSLLSCKNCSGTNNNVNIHCLSDT
ncbi:activation of phospholipase A2 activity by calcium-mediated signaling [Mactra antiquata]